MNCVLLGYGTVGKNVERLAHAHPSLHMKGVFVRPSKANEPYFTNDGMALVSDPETDIVFECLNGLEPAHTLITAALRHGKHVISSNKAVLAEHLPEYLQLAKEHGGSIQIEASAGGGIPVLDGILKLSLAENLSGMDGILNGTSNFILSGMEREGLSFDEALQIAQLKGYAEADPSADVEGIDVWNKTRLIAQLLSKREVKDLPAPLGISKVNKEDIDFARRNHRVLRHIALIRIQNGRYASIIAPVFLPADHFLANVGANYNAQLIYGDSFGSIGYFGAGAGGSETAQAMIADALNLTDFQVRPIELNGTAGLDPDLLRVDWIVRTNADLSSIAGASFRKDNVWLIEGRNAGVIEEVKALDDQAMMGVWNFS